MAFQVIADAPERDIVAGRVRIDFHVTDRFDGAATRRIQTETGTMEVATPETVAFDLVRFPGASGYWSNVATVLAELGEKLDPARLVAGASRVARSDVQRLGWLLDLALAHPEFDRNLLLRAFMRYMQLGGTKVTRAQFEANMAVKIIDAPFLADVPPLLRTGLQYAPIDAWSRVHSELISHLPGDPWKGDCAAR